MARRARSRADAGAVGIDLVSFGDEEGAFSAASGAASFAGRLDRADLDAARSRDGAPLREALAGAGLAGKPRERSSIRAAPSPISRPISSRGRGSRRPASTSGLSKESSACDARSCASAGRADHAGTTPMAMRRDAARRMFVFANAVNESCRALASPQSVWNIGIVRVAPGAGNIVPSDAEIMVEYRDTDAAVLDRMTEAILALVAREDGRDGVAVPPAAGRECSSPARWTAEIGELIAAAARGDRRLG